VAGMIYFSGRIDLILWQERFISQAGMIYSQGSNDLFSWQE